MKLNTMSDKNYFIGKANVNAVVFILLSLFCACKKDDVQFSTVDNNRIGMVLTDNFNLSLFNTALRKANLTALLQEEGPYTVLAPSNDAFAAFGYPTPAAVLGISQSRINQIGNYHILNGTYRLDRLPFLYNQELETIDGSKLYVTHWVKAPDTVLTINGSRVLAQNMETSNGLIQVIDRVLEPNVHGLLSEAIASETTLTLFYQLLLRSGALETLKGTGPYTVYAPNNTAMSAYGYPTYESIQASNPAELARFARYHIVQDRRFVYDYILSTDETYVSQQVMLDGNNIDVILIPNYQVPGSYTGISLRGTGNTTDANFVRQDILTGNGVLHIIDQVLRINQ